MNQPMTEQQHLQALRREIEFMREHVRLCYATIALLTIITACTIANLLIQAAL